ncbi:MAG: choice-of-anchor Q domain-containing protein, partial [Planctomycetota bacterium]|jgi:parallel beta-helix repeat protein
VTEIHVAQGVYTPASDGVSTCCTPHGGIGCDDAGCEALVCAAIPLCCAVGWDAACAAAAVDLCGGLCAEARTATFQLLDGVALRGGYAGIGELDPDARDVALYETTLSGDLAGNDGPGDFENYEENSYNVVTASGTSSSAVLDGFTISGGNADGTDTDPLSWRRGAGIWNLTGSPTVIDCLITANSAVYGGGMYNRENSDPEVTDCTLTGNRATGNGGGMLNTEGSDPTILNCAFDGNTGTEGGGMLNVRSSPTITDCDFVANEAGWGAGVNNFDNCHPVITGCTFVDNVGGCCGVGMQNAIGSSPTVTDCLFQGNLGDPTGSSGGGMRNIQDAHPNVTNCRFVGNFARDGGGMQNIDNSNPTVVNCEFLDNDATWGGGVEIFDNANPLLVGCLVVRNSASSGGGGVLTANNCFAGLVNCTILDNTTTGIGGGVWVSDAYGGHSENTVSNSIVRGNSPEQVLADSGATANVTYSDIQGGYAGAGNIDADPLFVDPGSGDYQLSAGSPSIDAANNLALPPGVTTDLDGNPRFVDDLCRQDTGSPPDDAPYVDMGAYEFQDRSCDLDGSGDVGVTDFLALLAAWGPCPAPCPPSCPADFDGDCEVGVTDFLILLAKWG